MQLTLILVIATYLILFRSIILLVKVDLGILNEKVSIIIRRFEFRVRVL